MKKPNFFTIELFSTPYAGTELDADASRTPRKKQLANVSLWTIDLLW